MVGELVADGGEVFGACVGLLEGVDGRPVEVGPRSLTLTVITGLSGSGKSSLAFDTIYAEGQRRYVESLSAYARQFLGLMEKPDVDAIEGYALAFRRSDYVSRGPLDEHFVFYRNLDIWWSLVLRDEGEGSTPRRAVSVEVPAVRHDHRGWSSLPDDERDRQSKRNFYRIIGRFGSRRDLLVGKGAAATLKHTAPLPRQTRISGACPLNVLRKE